MTCCFLPSVPWFRYWLQPDGLYRSTASAADADQLLAQQRQETEEARKQMELIPPPSKTRYMAVKSLSAWENPYVTVQGGMVTLHVMTGGCEYESLGSGGMLRPVGARRQELNVRVGELAVALNAVPEGAGHMDAWWRWKRRMRFRRARGLRFGGIWRR